MSGKTEALVRDLAALFVKYRLSDWAPVLNEIERRGGSTGLAEAIRRHAQDAKPATARKPTAKPKTVKRETPKLKAAAQLELEPRFTGPNASTVEQLRQALVSKTSLPSLPDLKAVHAALGIKSAGSSRRETLIAILTEHLDGLNDTGFEKALRAVASIEERRAPEGIADYDRWFQLITAGRIGK